MNSNSTPTPTLTSTPTPTPTPTLTSTPTSISNPDLKTIFTVRFAPEPSGHLHVGHTKALWLNQKAKEENNGKLILRFDDTNPLKEKKEYEVSILEDVRRWGVEPDQITHTSDYLDQMILHAEHLIAHQKAYVDDSPAEDMKEQRSQKLPSPCRNQSSHINHQKWTDMKLHGKPYVLRAKIDYKHSNGNMRDPTLCRVVDNQLCFTYDFACPVVDFLEKISLVLRDSNYRDRREQYRWIQSAINSENKNFQPSAIKEFSRMEFKGIDMSKTKMAELVRDCRVGGWDDPRLPTLKGWINRGLEIQALQTYVKSLNLSRPCKMELDKLWSLNRDLIDPRAVRVAMVNTNKYWTCTVSGSQDTHLQVPTHPGRGNQKNNDDQTQSLERTVYFSREIYVESNDGCRMGHDNHVVLMNWGRAVVTHVDSKQQHVALQILDSKDDNPKWPKPTLTLHWVGKDGCLKVKVTDYCGLRKTSEWYWGEKYLAGKQPGDLVQVFRDKGRYCKLVGYESDGTTQMWMRIPNGKKLKTEEFSISKYF